jgi:hypothetical protein
MTGILHADPDALDAAAGRLAAASSAVRHLHEHPGVLRGRALDGGDPELAVALVALADSWRDGLDAVADEAYRWSRLLASAAGCYRGVEQQVRTSWVTGWVGGTQR